MRKKPVKELAIALFANKFVNGVPLEYPCENPFGRVDKRHLIISKFCTDVARHNNVFLSVVDEYKKNYPGVPKAHLVMIWMRDTQVEHLKNRNSEDEINKPRTALFSGRKYTIQSLRDDLNKQDEYLKKQQYECRHGHSGNGYSQKPRIANAEWDKKNTRYRVYKHRLKKQGWDDMNNIEKINAALTELTKELINCSQKGAIWVVKWNDVESRRVRKDQMSNLKDLITVIKQLKDLREELQNETNILLTSPHANDDTVVLLAEAKDMLNKQRIKNDL